MSTDVYTGFWTNWSRGGIYGATLTLSSRDGGLLTAFFALFVTIVSTQLWRFLCFVVHQSRSTPHAQSRAFHQYQVILRNVETPSAAAWAFFILGYRNRKLNYSFYLKALPWVAISSVYVILFGLAAIFSSNISKAPGNARLVDSSTCGVWMADVGKGYSMSKYVNDTYTAANHARICYARNPSAPQCTRMPTSAISYTYQVNATCPFRSGLCVYGNNAAFEITSKKINSHSDLGINSPVKDRVEVQLIKTCAPLNQSQYRYEYVASANDTLGIVGDHIIEYQFGQYGTGIPGTRQPNMTTWVHNNHSAYGHAGYILGSYAWRAGATNESAREWNAIEALRSDADLSIFFLEANNIAFGEMNDDPMFGAHVASDKYPGRYASDLPVTVMACAERLRLCNPSNDVCTPYLGESQLHSYLVAHHQELLFSDDQWLIANRIRLSLDTVLRNQVTFRLSAALRIIEQAIGPFQFGTFADQWRIEIMAWYDEILAKLQLSVMEFAAGPSNRQYHWYYSIPNNMSKLGEQCKTQIVHDSTDTISFSVLGTTILFTLGIVIILLNIFAESIVAKIQNMTARGTWKRKCWEADDLMNLQITALQGKMGPQSTSSIEYGRGSYKHPELGRMSFSSTTTLTESPTSYDTNSIRSPQSWHGHAYYKGRGKPFLYTQLHDVESDHHIGHDRR